jgi:hypothetical protein
LPRVKLSIRFLVLFLVAKLRFAKWALKLKLLKLESGRRWFWKLELPRGVAKQELRDQRNLV